ncbi:MAG: RelA/SpoT family protein [Patescibacteria group bacterium]
MLELASLLTNPNLSETDKKLIEKAYHFAKEAHKDQKRFSGEPYFLHLYSTALILSELRMDAEVIAAGLLHDSVEDVGVTSEQLSKEFSPDIAFLVDGVTKLGALKYRGNDKLAENLRKLFVAMAQDIRVIVIKLADRLHNIRTLEHVRAEKQHRIALETLEIYAPIANRLGIGKIRDELEARSFRYAHPDEYTLTQMLLEEKAPLREKSLRDMSGLLEEAFKESDIQNADVSYRTKGVYSLYKKLAKNDMNIDKVCDIAAMRIIVPTVADCYSALGIVHSLWKPVPERVKDYIALPKINGYQSIHTSVFAGDGEIAEIQIRTREMHDEAEYGIAAHIAYRESGKPKTGGVLSKKLAWVRQLIEWQKQFAEGNEFIEGLKTDFFQDRIFCFTPKGDVIELPEGATTLDFAYAIHSDIGNHTSGAKINGKMVSLDSSLKNGDVVVIETRKNAKPSTKWLEACKTALARRHIRSYLNDQKDQARP